MSARIIFVLACILVLVPQCFAETGYIARGDILALPVSNHSGGSCWFFPSGGGDGIYDIPTSTAGNITYCFLDGDKIGSLNPGKYFVVHQYPPYTEGRPSYKDISWKGNSLVSIYSDVKPINEAGKQSMTILEDFRKIAAIRGTDTLEESVLFVQEPFVKIHTIEQISNMTLRISGTSNLADGTEVEIVIDRDDNYAKGDLQRNTFYASVDRDGILFPEGTWSCDMILPLQSFTPGKDHFANVIAGDVSTGVTFPISEMWETDEIPMTKIKYLDNGNIAPEIINVTVTVTITFPPEVRYLQLTATPTPDITDALGEKIAYPFEPGKTISGYYLLAALGIIACIIIYLTVRWRTKK